MRSMIRNRTPRAIVSHSNQCGRMPGSAQIAEIMQVKQRVRVKTVIYRTLAICKHRPRMKMAERNLPGAIAGSVTNTVVAASCIPSST